MRDFLDRLLDEPILLTGLAVAIIGVLVIFGLADISDEQTEAIVALILAVVAIVGALFGRRQVTPMRKLDRQTEPDAEG